MRLYGAGGVTRTPDLLITNQLLYRLSYTSIVILTAHMIPHFYPSVNTLFSILRQSLRVVFVYYILYYCKFSCNINIGVFLFCISYRLPSAEKTKNFVAVFLQFLADPL